MKNIKIKLTLFIIPFIVSCSSNLKDSEGNTYETVKIGNKFWMAENLNSKKFNNGDKIPYASSVEEWINYGKNKQPAWCYSNNIKKSGFILYNWYVVSDKRGISPLGWHIPNKNEWNELIKELGGVSIASKSLKSKTGWEKNSNGNNNSGFNALPNGTRNNDGKFGNLSCIASWWSSSYLDSENSYFTITFCTQNEVAVWNSFNSCGLAIRCVK